MDKTFCSKSKDCKKHNCPRHLKGFNGLYISLAEFDCEKELNEIRDEKARENA
jgi:hypothetical protein